MKTQLCFLLTVCITLFTVFSADALNFYINFTGSGAATTVDSVIVQNLTKGTLITVPAGMVLQLTDVDNAIDELNTTSNLASVYPNPLTKKAIFTFLAKNGGNTQIGIYSLDGRKLTGYDIELQQGKNSFQLTLPLGVYLVQAKGNDYSYTVRAISFSSTDTKPLICFNEQTSLAKPQKAPASEVKLQYTAGDQILYKGYSGNFCTIVTDKPTESKSTDFKFVDCTDADGNHYAVVHIGTQTWMAENLKTTKYRNGEAIGTTLFPSKDISNETTPKYQWPCEGFESMVDKYGRLYTWYSVDDVRNIAPAGWHVPTDDEWTIFEYYLIYNGYNYDSTTSYNKIAKALATTTDWYNAIATGSIGNDLSKNNSSGFTALASGHRKSGGSFYSLKDIGYWWNSNADDYKGTNCRYLYAGGDALGRYTYNRSWGFSVRCIKD